MVSLLSSSFRSRISGAAAMLLASMASAQVSSYTFSQTEGTWQPIAGNGTPLGMPGLQWPFTFDDNSFVTQGESLPLGSTPTGNGWPIGFTFTFNGHPYDRVGLSMEGWLAFGNSPDGTNAVYVPVGSQAYAPLSTALPAGMDPLKRDRVAGFAMDLAALGNGGTWPLQIKNSGQAPNRSFVAEWNVVRSGGSNAMSFQVRLNEGGGNPAAQTVQVIFGTMPQTAALNGQVGLGGNAPDDFNNRSVPTSPYDWTQSQPGLANTATCRPPSSATYLPQGLTFTWTPPGCMVSGIIVSDLAIGAGNITGTLSWNALPGATGYNYIITAGGPDDPVLFSGSGITGTTVALDALPADQELTAYVAADCGEGIQGWGAGHPFTTGGLVEVICGDAPAHFTHCYGNLEQTVWKYTGTSAAPLRMIINEGAIFNGDLLTIHDGPTDQSPLLFSSATGPIAGQVINSTGQYLTMKLISDDLGSCATQDFIDPMEWEVGCLDCQQALVNFNVVPDCDNDQYSVQANVFSLGSATSLVLVNDRNSNTVPISATGNFTIGPFPKDSVVVVTAQNPANNYCSAVSLPLVNGPCAIQSCGPDNYIYCYTNNDPGQWLYQSTGTERIGIRFRSGTLSSADVIQAYDGSDPFMSIPLFNGDNGGDLRNLLLTTSANNTEDALLLAVSSDANGSCADGGAQPWNYVVACYDGCSQPQAGFTVVDNCAAQQFSVAVAITDIGSTGSVTITNDGGAASVPATVTGTYTVGPFPTGAQVKLEVEGASKLCSWTSPMLTDGCDNIGIAELQATQLGIYPNPNDGAFKIVPPANMRGPVSLNILDVAGRTVFTQEFNNQGEDHLVDLTALTNGAYAVILSNNGTRATGQLHIVR